MVFWKGGSKSNCVGYVEGCGREVDFTDDEILIKCFVNSLPTDVGHLVAATKRGFTNCLISSYDNRANSSWTTRCAAILSTTRKGSEQEDVRVDKMTGKSSEMTAENQAAVEFDDAI